MKKRLMVIATLLILPVFFPTARFASAQETSDEHPSGDAELAPDIRSYAGDSDRSDIIAFRSVSVYNKDGFFEHNKYNAYSVNSLTGTPNKDGSITIHFGGDPASANYLPITEDWNYAVRFYKPRREILDGTWKFPDVKPVE